MLAGVLCACALIVPGYGQETAGARSAAMPNFAGVWNRNGGRMGAVRNLSERPMS